MFFQKISYLMSTLQERLFPFLEERFQDPVLESHKKVAAILEVVKVELFIPVYVPFTRGRPPKFPIKIARAFIAKHVLNLSTVSLLIHMLKCDKNLRYICGWQPGERIPSESTFSRVFADLAYQRILERAHEALAKEVCHNELVFHCSRDSVPVPVQERPSLKIKKSKKRTYEKPTVIQKQGAGKLSVEEMMALLRTNSSLGRKVNSTGIAYCWQGYKLHMDVADGWLPLSCMITSACTHDSQAAIPLSKMTSSRATVLYELMDTAYDVKEIRSWITSQDRVPLIKIHRRNGKRKEERDRELKAQKILNWQPAEEKRLKQRMASERLFARLKTSFATSIIRVKGASKVMCQLMLGVISLTADEILRWSG